MRHRVVAALVALGALLACASSPAEEAVWGLGASGLVGMPIADGDGRSARAAIEPSLKWNLQGIDIRARARLRWLNQLGEQRTDVDVRELTAAWRAGDSTFTVGAQQLNWGRMDIVRVIDGLNPVDLNDLFYEELPEAKLALWMANWEWQRGSQTLQVVVTPQVPVDRFPASWAGLPVQVAKPRTSLANATLALRYGFEALGFSVDLVAARGWLSAPVLRPGVDVTSAAGVRLQGLVSRQNSLGFSADKPIGATVLRVEGQYARVLPDHAGLSSGLQARRQTTLGTGLDVREGAWFVAGQVIAQFDDGAATGSTRNTYVSAIVQRKWLQDLLAARALHIRETRSGSAWSSLQATYQLTPQQVVQLQGDWFTGEPTQVFGSFAGRSRVSASVRVQF